MKSVKIAIIVVALAAALFITLWTRSEGEPPPQAAESNVTWKCRDCGAVFELTSKASQEALAKAGGKPPIECGRCNKVEAYMPLSCIICNEYILGADVPGSTGRCPRCEPDAEPVYDQEEEQLLPEDQQEGAPQPRRVRPKSV